MQEVKRECFNWSLTKDSLLHGDNPLVQFNPAHIWREICARAPLLVEILKAATDVRRDRRGVCFDEDQRHHLIMCVAIIMKLRSNKRFHFIQSLIGASLYDGHASKQVSIYVCIQVHKTCMLHDLCISHHIHHRHTPGFRNLACQRHTNMCTPKYYPNSQMRLINR